MWVKLTTVVPASRDGAGTPLDFSWASVHCVVLVGCAFNPFSSSRERSVA